MTSTQKHWSSPDEIREQVIHKEGVFHDYDTMLANHDSTNVITEHNADSEQARHCLGTYQFIAARHGVIPQAIADVGCGAGFMAATCKQIFPHAEVIGFDASDSAIKFARTYCSDVEYQCSIIEENSTLPKPGPYDLIFCHEFYPFSRCNDFTLHLGLIRTLLTSLPPHGIVCLGQAITNNADGSIAETLPQLTVALAPHYRVETSYFMMRHVTHVLGFTPLAQWASNILTPILKATRGRHPMLCVTITPTKN